MNFKRVLLPVDFSEPCEASIRWAAKVIGKEPEYWFVYVFRTPDGYVVWSGDPKVEIRKDLQELAEKYSELLGGRVHSEVVMGHPATEICRFAESHECDGIVLATHGRTGLKHLFLGSTAEQVVRHATVPVVITRREAD